MFFPKQNDIVQLLNISYVTDWASRCKQIMKIWRKVSATDKVPYLVSSVLFFVNKEGCTCIDSYLLNFYCQFKTK